MTQNLTPPSPVPASVYPDPVLSAEEIRQWVAKTRQVDLVEKLPGDASTRLYFRVVSGAQSFVAMKMESFAEHGDRLPFLAVQKHLAEGGIDVPAVLGTLPEKGLMLLEDLGDVTMLKRLQEVSNADLERQLYERVIDGLVRFQFECSPARKPAELDAFKLRFDVDKLMWEVNFTIEHFYQTYLKRDISAPDLRLMQTFFHEMCSLLAKQPTVLTHRDFHSRNVMVLHGEPWDRFVMIDFQDARLGPAQYDLASLLKDSYYQLEDAQVTRLIDYYIARWEAATGEPVDRARFTHIFDLMSVQRNFKAIGSFASFLNRRGNATYLKYIGNTFENIRRTLLKYPRYSDLREVLFHYYYF
jgi:aminoglycoside/choline kinase family phosphotransferase